MTHVMPTINSHHRAIDFERFMSIFNSIPQDQDHSFREERWYVLSQCGQHIYSVVIYFCHFDQCVQYNAQRVR